MHGQQNIKIFYSAPMHVIQVVNTYITKVKVAVVKLPCTFFADNINVYLRIPSPNYLKILIDQSRKIL
jgi:hypothetical protein